ncbi:MAG TPA: helix-turn-helix transcriptional regulator [Pyrinomonadaceae bacterium]|nr:helix-turn-helix transcriptional regulator [Pyrinomonadaceae bacterium]
MAIAYEFNVWVKDKRELLGWTQEKLAEEAKTTKQTISSIERQAKHPISEAPYRPSIEMVDAIAEALGESKDEARVKALYLPEDFDKQYNLEEVRLLKHFNELPRECQLDVLALTEALWRRRKAPRKNSTGGKAREVQKPQEAPAENPKRRVS